MKLVSFVLAVALALSVATAYAGGKTEAYPHTPINPAYGMARGFANIMTGWLEIPRGLVYENARIPVVGFVTGPVKGAFLTTWRELAGVTDVMTFGLTGKGLYYKDVVPDFVWDAQWIPSTQGTYVNPRQGKDKPGKKKHAPTAHPCGQCTCTPPCPPPCPPACPPRCGHCK
jgi:putative exosortase-associated protein (TIGR04073 family)